MNQIGAISEHTFHIPVLGLSYSIDTPIKVARFGISSVVSIIDDELLEDMRAFHCANMEWSYEAILPAVEDYRAKRISSYLNLMQDVVVHQMNELHQMDFEGENDLMKYFELLPSESIGRKLFEQMIVETDKEVRKRLQDKLRNYVVAGSIDVNIMSKVDNQAMDDKGNPLPDEYSDALSALRGFALSKLQSAVIFSAGYNPRLYAYAEQFDDFYPDADGYLKKRIILKVSDYRSALIQGKILAKKGLWVSEFRIESGLNCGGHAFATDGILMGPILEEFRANRLQLMEELFQLCNEGLVQKNRTRFEAIPCQRISAQGGIGTAKEHTFLLQHFELDAAGWGSPFLLVPEATNVDEVTLNQLVAASPEDYYLSYASPLGVPFHNFKKSTSEQQRKLRIAKGRPGSPCYKKYLSSNTEFTDTVICTASRQYQNLKIQQLESMKLPQQELIQQVEGVHEKDCLCEGLTVSVRLKNKMKLPHRLSAVTICPGPNLAYFSGVFSLKEMVDHIYGRKEIAHAVDRPHMFINELQLYVDYLRKQINACKLSMTDKQRNHFEKFRSNLLNGIAFYTAILPRMSCKSSSAMHLNGLKIQVAELSV